MSNSTHLLLANSNRRTRGRVYPLDIEEDALRGSHVPRIGIPLALYRFELTAADRHPALIDTPARLLYVRSTRPQAGADWADDGQQKEPKWLRKNQRSSRKAP